MGGLLYGATTLMAKSRFWVLLAAFQVAFGIAVFALTRDYYMRDQGSRIEPPNAAAGAPITWPEGMSESFAAQLDGAAATLPVTQDPVEISRLADEFFVNRQYDQAAQMYERLLAFGPKNADVLNNLGLTLHYLGRSSEALGRLNEGVALDPGNQRIWLTLGFVNSQLGNVDEARAALSTATQVGTDESIRESARKMLDGLP